MIRVEFQGTGPLIDSFHRYFDRLPPEIYREAVFWGDHDAMISIREVLEPHRRTGSLARWLRWRVITEGERVSLELAAEVPYARIQEFGGIINAKPGGWLTVPLPAALDARRVARRARTYPNTFIQRSRRGNLLIFQRRGKEIVPLFVLRKQVRLPGIKYGRRGVERALPKLYQRIAIVIEEGKI